ncbi:MAG: hypothetical protein CMJ34_04225 [Phycisphaerae bacterium]|nr:hypothetical protein [Phycisphaerae bacterium]
MILAGDRLFGLQRPLGPVNPDSVSARTSRHLMLNPHTLVLVLLACLNSPGIVLAQESSESAGTGMLVEPVQLTFNDRFVKAGESYYSPDGSKVIFQAVEQVEEGVHDDFYAMFVADTVRDASGRTRSLENIRRISPEGSANTCGWFHPTDPNIVIFGTTLAPPSDETPPGYQRGSGRYRWQFPPEMRIVATDLRTNDGTANNLDTLAGDGNGYVAECSFSPDGRHLLYTSLESGQGDIYVKDLSTGRIAHLISAPGYDGGPFFSPDGRRIVYRSDRHGNNLLQVFVAELEHDEDGRIIGVTREHQVTDDSHVNWCPFWHPDGRHVLYSTSREGHRNYEVFMVDAMGDLDARPVTGRYGTGIRRVTDCAGADVLPAFNADGSELIWTSKRGPSETSQLWTASFRGDLASPSAASPGGRPGSRGS